ncbi:MAG: hypothetical protein JJE04_19470 [Acidobacteriia bacterium]|nr:hypothetical protein [Terriglobia bacterium]
MRLKTTLLVISLLAVSTLAVSCSTAEGPPASGSPPFYWAASQETFLAADYLKASQHLEKIARNGEYAGRVMPWRLILLSGLMQGYVNIAEQYEHGSRNNKTTPGPLRRQMSDFRSMAAQQAMLFGEAYVEFEKNAAEGDVPVACPFPSRGSLAMVPQMARTAQGMVLPGAEAEKGHRAMLERAVMGAVCQAVGAKGDAPRAQQLLKTPPLQVPRATFELAMAAALYEAGKLFGAAKLSQPDRQDFFYDQTISAIGTAPVDKDAKEWKAEIEKHRKARNNK